MNNIANKRKLEAEQAWYAHPPRQDNFWQRLLHHPLVFSYARIQFNYLYPKVQMGKMAESHLPETAEKILVAPSGRGDDFRFLKLFGRRIYGLDVSSIALASCPKEMGVAAGDIRKLPYRDETFDLIAAPLFFHHHLGTGFHPFLREFHRILKPGGGILLLEPSIWYPLNLITRPLKRIFRNPYHEVEDEDPFRPGILLGALRECGFVHREIRAATFSHVAFYIPLAKIINRLGAPLLSTWPFMYFGWLVLFWGEKSNLDTP